MTSLREAERGRLKPPDTKEANTAPEAAPRNAGASDDESPISDERRHDIKAVRRQRRKKQRQRGSNMKEDADTPADEPSSDRRNDADPDQGKHKKYRAETAEMVQRSTEKLGSGPSAAQDMTNQCKQEIVGLRKQVDKTMLPQLEEHLASMARMRRKAHATYDAQKSQASHTEGQQELSSRLERLHNMLRQKGTPGSLREGQMAIKAGLLRRLLRRRQ